MITLALADDEEEVLEEILDLDVDAGKSIEVAPMFVNSQGDFCPIT